jgi:hypothetical protein
VAVEDLLIQTCSTQRKTVSVGSRGQTDATWATIESGIRCNIQLATIVREEYVLEQHGETTLTTFLGFFEFGKDIQEGDLIILDSPSTKFHVDRVHPDSVGRSSHMEADLEKVDH